MVVNEVASQLCRFKPGLLFHKRELFQLAKRVADSCHEEIEAAQGQIAAGLMCVSSQQQQQHQHMQSQQPQESAQVSGQVANSQLAMLESRGLTAIQPTTTSAAEAAVHASLPQQQLSLGEGMVLAYTKDGDDHTGLMNSPNNLQTVRGKQSIGNNAQVYIFQFLLYLFFII